MDVRGGIGAREQRLVGHAVVALSVVGGYTALVTPEDVQAVPGDQVAERRCSPIARGCAAASSPREQRHRAGAARGRRGGQGLRDIGAACCASASPSAATITLRASDALSLAYQPSYHREALRINRVGPGACSSCANSSAVRAGRAARCARSPAGLAAPRGSAARRIVADAQLEGGGRLARARGELDGEQRPGWDGAAAREGESAR